MQQLQELKQQIESLPNIECNCDLVYPDPDDCPHKNMVRRSRVVDMLRSKIDELEQARVAAYEGMRDYGEPV